MFSQQIFTAGNVYPSSYARQLVTDLGERSVEHLLSIDTPPFPIDHFSSVKDLCFAVLRNIKPAGLRVGQGAGKFALDSRPLEATFQDEFYRACYTLLGKQLYLSSEWTGTKKGGRVDFQVRGTHWAIEIVRDGDNIDEHIERFRPGGRYHPWLQDKEIRDYAILDFRRSKPQIVRGRYSADSQF